MAELALTITFPPFMNGIKKLLTVVGTAAGKSKLSCRFCGFFIADLKLTCSSSSHELIGLLLYNKFVTLTTGGRFPSSSLPYSSFMQSRQWKAPANEDKPTLLTIGVLLALLITSIGKLLACLHKVEI